MHGGDDCSLCLWHPWHVAVSDWTDPPPALQLMAAPSLPARGVEDITFTSSFMMLILEDYIGATAVVTRELSKGQSLT